ncbi:hypothetical protein FRC0522_02197 [Corynebacterium diphtheriae]|nr:hypothetical protein CIP107570_02162 [Corynebacterium diphtheriae]CAB1025217.1 hypothetical protein FRC0522_02197 [Corynebacterium diphtheriae]
MNTLTRGILSVHQTGMWVVTPRGSKNKEPSWAEKPHTINEVGSIFTLQGFDLNYAGVIIGPSVQYRDGKIVFVPKESHNPNVRAKRTLSDGSKKPFAEDLLRNQLNVLMTPRCPRCLSRLRAPKLQRTELVNS